MQTFTIDINTTTPISVHSKTYSTSDLGFMIKKVYEGIGVIRNIYLQIDHDDIIVKVVLKNRASDRELSKLIDAQVDVHEKFNYSFAFNFEYIQEEQFVEADSDYKIL
jgi:hypothetical protein